MTDLESYRDMRGNLRHDIAFEAGGGSQVAHLSMTEAFFRNEWSKQQRNGLAVRTLSVWHARDGSRRYSAVWRSLRHGAGAMQELAD